MPKDEVGILGSVVGADKRLNRSVEYIVDHCGQRLEALGAGDGIRTHDILLGKQTLYP